MQFFLPHAGSEPEVAYQRIVAILKSQFRLPIMERRIFSLRYTNSKRRWRAEVGELEQQEGLYEILAIFESKSYIIYTRTRGGNAGPIIMVAKDEVTAVEEFTD
ncbi:MAG TPA: hypothetical protein VLI05_02835 [Candidatus Saccharimonadia bacterium]|nr:hypothetical protein [Candidatus Saccharimonadia bacterium]